MDLNKILQDGRAARKAKRRHLFRADRIKQALGVDKEANSWAMEEFDVETDPIGDRHPGLAAVTYAREALSQFDIPSRVGLRYTGMKRRSGSGAHHLKDGVVWVQADFRSVSGAKHNIDIPIMVHDGHMVYPEIFMQNGRPRVMAQSAFDEILKNSEVTRRLQDRKHMFMPGPTDSRAPKEEVPVASTGMFGLTAQRSQVDEIPGAYGSETTSATMLEDMKTMLSKYQERGIQPTTQFVELWNELQQDLDKQYKQADRSCDEAERDRSDYLCPGEKVTLANDVTLKSRGGAMKAVMAGTTGVVIRDMFGTGDVYYVELDDGCKIPVNKSDIA